MSGKPDIPELRPLLDESLSAPESVVERLKRDYEDLADTPYPDPIEDHIRETYAVDLQARYGPCRLKNPIGKASGQLSLQVDQVRGDIEQGLAFVVLKTVIAEDPSGSAEMEAWKIHAPRMVCERVRSRNGREGWTVSWRGRGWEGDLRSYLEFFEAALGLGRAADVPVIPSVKYHLPASFDEAFRSDEYRHTTSLLDASWRRINPDRPLVLEKDFSPTLAGSDRVESAELIRRWLETVPRLAKEVLPSREIIIGVKVMNALFDDAFQLDMLRWLCAPDGAADFVITFNRLFDPEKSFGAHRGIAHGGHDLSDRNLHVLGEWTRESASSESPRRDLPISGTGNIVDGRLAVEYALRGCTSLQLHTFFQLPRQAYRCRAFGRSRAALHEILFHPRTGMIAALAAIRERWLGLETAATIRFLDLPRIGRERLSRPDPK